MSFKDKTFCASPDCVNQCGRQMTDHEKEELEELNNKLKQRMSEAFSGKNNGPIWMHGVSYGYFCGEPKGVDHD